jgi:monothiol glutaredoxin
MNTLALIKQQIQNNTVILYMKGTPQFPMCGFSAQVVQILKNLKAKVSYVNVLENPDIRVELPKYAQWPTFPQLYINGQLIGGCDIVVELQENNELLPALQSANAILVEKAEFEVA